METLETLSTTFEVVGKVSRVRDYYILKRELPEGFEPRHTYHVVSAKFWEENKDKPVKEHLPALNRQRIVRVISRTIFLQNGAVLTYWVADDKAKTVLDKLRHKTKNGLLEQAVILAEGSDTPDANKVLRGIDEVIYYGEFSKEMKASGLQFGLGFPGDAYGIMLGVSNGFGKELYIIFEEVHSYVEGYAVERYIVPARFINVLETEKFKGVLEKIKEFYGE